MLATDFLKSSNDSKNLPAVVGIVVATGIGVLVSLTEVAATETGVFVGNRTVAEAVVDIGVGLNETGEESLRVAVAVCATGATRVGGNLAAWAGRAVLFSMIIPLANTISPSQTAFTNLEEAASDNDDVIGTESGRSTNLPTLLISVGQATNNLTSSLTMATASGPFAP